jgi:hypothetical protein
MRLRCFLSRRSFVAYLDRELGVVAISRVEDHLADCFRCRARLVRLRDGRRLARQLPSMAPPTEGWTALEAALDKEDASRRQPRPAKSAGWLTAPARLSILAMGAGLVLAGGLFALYTRMSPANRTGQEQGLAKSSGWVVDTRDFREVTIDEMDRNTDPHVVAEGFVSEVRMDEEEGDLTFRLVDDMRQPRPFIVCEIINPINVAVPAVGSRVRVYGVSRYDAKADHQWYEVHPVLDIQAVR